MESTIKKTGRDIVTKTKITKQKLPKHGGWYFDEYDLYFCEMFRRNDVIISISSNDCNKSYLIN